jgi:hypothetical protein
MLLRQRAMFVFHQLLEVLQRGSHLAFVLPFDEQFVGDHAAQLHRHGVVEREAEHRRAIWHRGE